jgi:C-terminal processing protease CtpA/Prc
LEQNVADFLVQGGGEKLPERGMLGLYLVDSEDGVKVTELTAEGKAIKAGVEENDLILKVNDQRVRDMVDLKMVLMDEAPGNKVTLRVLRKRFLQTDKEMDLSFELGN